jgi:hypothetical protein
MSKPNFGFINRQEVGLDKTTHFRQEVGLDKTTHFRQ